MPDNEDATLTAVEVRVLRRRHIVQQPAQSRIGRGDDLLCDFDGHPWPCTTKKWLNTIDMLCFHLEDAREWLGSRAAAPEVQERIEAAQDSVGFRDGMSALREARGRS